MMLHNVHIFVPPSNWGEGRRKDVETLLRNTASHVEQLLREPFTESVRVIPGPIDKNPIIRYRLPTDTQYTIKLSARGRKWNKYAYQFAHEFCHALSEHDKLKNNPNNWFHETICELASFFTLRRMTERWQSDPPYENWADYACNFEKYYHQTLSDYGINITDSVVLNSWMLEHEEVLREDPYQREKNALVAYQLLPIFEEIPTGWNAIRKFPTSTGYLKEYLIDWYLLVDSEDKLFVARISNKFGYSITSEN